MSGLLSIIKQDNRRTRSLTSDLGTVGEALAAEFLVESGYRIVMANFKVPVGRNSKGVQVTGEIDIVALDGETLCFVEVKTRRSEDFTPIETNVDLRKRRQITRTARVYRKVFNVYAMEHRYDVITVLMPKGEAPRIELAKDFWNESSFRKARWNYQLYNDFV